MEGHSLSGYVGVFWTLELQLQIRCEVGSYVSCGKFLASILLNSNVYNPTLSVSCCMWSTGFSELKFLEDLFEERKSREKDKQGVIHL